ncbi:MAG: fibrobacter succinogenes major paralogous domain-containing protein [Bacteroidales bacterium]|nr:fibrobacter succinogenes major paralogous domain-containing protein [Bacteroidales bacterium]
MKKLILFASALCMSVCAMAQTAFFVYKTDGSHVKYTIADVDSISFTVPTTGTENGYEWVDLGLSVKWATCNVGATKPEEYGNYYAWGETEPKNTYDWNTYKWATATWDATGEFWDLATLTKYNTDSDYGIVDNKTVLELADDAARANWGGAWRIPTDAEWTELRENCTWTWTSDYNGTGVKGEIVTSNINGNSIFLPAAGLRYDGGLDYYAGKGSYWSSSLGTDYSDRAWSVPFASGYMDRFETYRYCGRPVRPVL